MEVRMKWKLAALGVLVLGAVVSGTAALRSLALLSDAQVPPAVEEPFTDHADAAYILKEREGYVAVFSAESGKPVHQTAIRVSTLPQADQAMLRLGIAAADRQEVLTLLEDLGS